MQQFGRFGLGEALVPEQVAALPEEEREVFDLLWYQGLPQAEAADLLHVNVRTIKRRWLSARMKLQDALQGEMPE